MIGQEHKKKNKRTMFPAPKNNAAAGYKGPVKIELLKGAGLLSVDNILRAAKKTVNTELFLECLLWWEKNQSDAS